MFQKLISFKSYKRAYCSCRLFSLITKRSHNLLCNMNVQQMNPRFIGTPKEKFAFFNTLLCLVKSLQGQYVNVDLRNDSNVCGLLLTVDGFMNLSFSTAVYCDPQGNEFFFENIFVQCRNVRYVHIPEHVSIINNIKNEVAREVRNKPTGTAMNKSRKAKKAYNQHMQTVASLCK
ncbi:PREDICTED: U7 snRNA-associated Sm-like protein LSm10 isoform X2 [Papilio xuthus]|uniref:U7 snRNA-associated Sm-like protein LSm10 isoform X2 n=1 Tax=Papilio xuthus TaxID=66420 RepID=A0AAJ6Z7R9_PAPXU|nr:PREDICTED: U7 snRNA-associated Sm-like protein LSm10 isoform X2 [Papilio xuthus]